LSFVNMLVVIMPCVAFFHAMFLSQPLFNFIFVTINLVHNTIKTRQTEFPFLKTKQILDFALLIFRINAFSRINSSEKSCKSVSKNRNRGKKDNNNSSRPVLD